MVDTLQKEESGDLHLYDTPRSAVLIVAMKLEALRHFI